MSNLTFIEILVRIPIIILWITSIVSLHFVILKFIFLWLPEYLVKHMEVQKKIIDSED